MGSNDCRFFKVDFSKLLIVIYFENFRCGYKLNNSFFMCIGYEYLVINFRCYIYYKVIIINNSIF